jgi:hypothetical protein
MSNPSEFKDVFGRMSLHTAQGIFATSLAWWISFATILAVLIVPLFLTDMPPLLDYPNHLARVFVLANVGEDPVLSRMYAPHWSLIPNLAFDVLGLLLLQIFPLHIAGRVLIGLAVLLPVAGFVFYARTVSGVRSYWPLGAGLLGYNALLLLGFLNLQISLGLAFIAAAIWRSGRDRWHRESVLVVAVLAIAIFFSHIIGLVFLGILLCADEAADARVWRDARSLCQRFSRLAIVFLTPAILYLSSGLATDDTATGWVGWTGKLAILLHLFFNYDWRLDIATAAVVIAVLYAGLVVRAGTVSRPAGIAFLIAMLLFVVTPRSFKGGSYFDYRFLLLAMFLLFACFLPKRGPNVLAAVAGSAIGLLFLVRMVVLGLAWHGHTADVSQLRQTISTVEPGGRVVVVTVGPQSAAAYWAERKWRAGMIDGFRRTDSHMASLLLIERRAFWPLLFAVPNQHPIAVQSPYREIAVTAGELPEYSLLEKDRLSEDEARLFPYLREWAARFDYVLVLNAGGAPELRSFLRNDLQLIESTEIAALFRIKRSA